MKRVRERAGRAAGMEADLGMMIAPDSILAEMTGTLDAGSGLLAVGLESDTFLQSSNKFRCKSNLRPHAVH